MPGMMVVERYSLYEFFYEMICSDLIVRAIQSYENLFQLLPLGINLLAHQFVQEPVVMTFYPSKPRHDKTPLYQALRH